MYSLKNVLKNIEKLQCSFENRPKKYMFGLKNYGDIPQTINKADGDPWDIFAPGQKKLNTNKMYKIKKCLGILLLSDGNHKIAVCVEKDFDKYEALKEIDIYTKKYCKYVGVTGSFVPFVQFQ